MTSQINPNNIDGTYPVAGQPNNTQGFRDNFTNIKTNFSTAKDEITDLENKVIVKAALTGTTIDNNMADNLIYAVKLQDLSYTYVPQTITSGAIPIDYAAGQYQSISPTGSVSLSFTNWPSTGSEGVLYVDVVVTNTAYTVTLPVAVSVGTTGIQGYSANVITFGATGTYRFGFSSVDSGTTIAIYDLNRPLSYYTNTVNVVATTISTSSTTGALIVAGGVGIGGNLYVNGDIFGNITIGDFSTGNITATGNITGSNLLTAGIISATGTITSAGNLSLTGNIVDIGELWINTSANGNINLNVNGTGQTNIPTGILSVTGNIQGGNLRTAGLISATGNIQGGNLRTAGLISATGTVTGSSHLGAVVSVTGNVTGGNVLTTGYFLGDGGYLSNITVYSNVAATQIVSGTTQMAVEVPSGNIQATIGGIANVILFTQNGANITGYVTATGNVIGGNIRTAGLITATGNIIGGNVEATSFTGATVSINGVVTGGTLSSTGNVNTVGIVGTGNISTTGNISGGNLLAAGLSLSSNVISNLNVTSNIAGGNILTAGLVSATGNIQGGNVITGGLISVTGNVILTGNVIGGNLTTSNQVVALGNITGGNIQTDGQARVMSNTAPTAGGVAAYLMSSTASLGVFFGSGVPTITAAQGSLYMRTDGSTTNDRLYVNTNGTTGWTAVTTAS
jgi:hypothetical protein